MTLLVSEEPERLSIAKLSDEFEVIKPDHKVSGIVFGCKACKVPAIARVVFVE